MSNIQIFSSPEFGQITTAIINGKEYFAATECAKALGYIDPYDAIKRHTKGSVKHRVPTAGGEQEVNFISEGDLFRLIIGSHLLSAELFERWIFDIVLPTIRKQGYYAMPSVEFHRLHERIDKLADENYLLRQRVNGLASGHGSFQLWDVAQQLRKNGIGNGNVGKVLTMMIDNGLLCKDTSVKKRHLYRPYLKDIKSGYFDHELTHNGQPVPVWQSQITITARGLDWIIATLLSLKDCKWQHERPMIRYSRETQRRLAELPPEAGGRITVHDYYGNDVIIE